MITMPRLQRAVVCGQSVRAWGGRKIQDARITAICLAHGATLATREIKDFEGLDLRLVNPFEDC
ncbi:hypothetical protein IE4872_CH00459 [Rhizobium gallicum]|uniref:PilT domain-containing protein n=1 Tax=Rhizobium gallicum TaxID=56730 RepID=A0A1L5NE08_9HYPH|nr:hypothetical protein IE4872_CH00459 [Rhizobium gallicum]